MKIKSSPRRSPSLLAVPILPPFAALLTLLLGLVMWRITKKRLRFLAWPMDQVALRVAAFAGAVAVAFAVFETSKRLRASVGKNRKGAIRKSKTVYA